jgi:hypothetical protein
MGRQAVPRLLEHVVVGVADVRIEKLLFDGARQQRDGFLRPPLERPGLGIELRAADAERYAA